jgi:aminopeptidase N
MKRYIFLIYLLIAIHVTPVFCQILDNKAPSFSRADTLRGSLGPLRTCFDVTYYNIDLRINPESRSLAGSVDIHFTVMKETNRIQLDLFENMIIDSITYAGSLLKFTREINAFYVSFQTQLELASKHKLTVYYHGEPVVAKMPPWDGGFAWSKDRDGNHWVGVAVQGTGASLWWPNKDHQSDEPDSVKISVEVPEGLMNVSNGRLRSLTRLADGWTKYTWFVSEPINNYNVTINIANYTHFGDIYVSGSDTLTLDYYVLPYNLEKARKQFEQVKPMMACFENYLGPYPFYRDGYKLIETTYLGMEHQSAIAYGNRYMTGYRGVDRSGLGLNFDYIIIHETGHEWWGNSITTKDIADLWVHEGFCTYSEALYVECLYGYETAMKYVNNQRRFVLNKSPVRGVYGLNNEGSSDMYGKGALFLNTLRHVVDSDILWFAFIKGLNHDFRHRTIDGEDVIKYVYETTGRDFSYFFEQYTRHGALPKLIIEYKKSGKNLKIRHRWQAGVPDFKMPVKYSIAGNTAYWFYPVTTFQDATLLNCKPTDLRVLTEQFYIDVEIRKKR